MEFERDDVPTTQFQTKSASRTRVVEPLLYLEHRIIDEGTSVGDEFQDFQRKIEVNIQWISRIDVEGFVDLRREVLVPRNDVDEVHREEVVENALLEEHVEAYVEGESGSNTLDYEALADRDFQDLRTAVQEEDDSIDWGQLSTAEQTNRNRTEVKNWIDEKRRTERSRRYDTLRFSQLESKEFYPNRIGKLGFGFIGPPEVAYWNGVGGLIGFTPDAEERNTGEREERLAYQEEMDEEYSHISCNFSSYQRVDKDEEGNFHVKFDKPLDNDLSMERFGWYFERTIPDDYLSRARKAHGYNSNDEVIKAVYELVTEEISEVAEEYDLRRDDATPLPSFNERISSDLSLK